MGRLVPVPVDGDDPQTRTSAGYCPWGSSKTYENSLMDDPGLFSHG